MSDQYAKNTINYHQQQHLLMQQQQQQMLLQQQLQQQQAVNYQQKINQPIHPQHIQSKQQQINVQQYHAPQPQPQSNPQQASNNQDLASSSNIHLALLGLAETFLKTGQYRLSIHCLESILTLKLQDVSIITNFHILLKTRLNLCRLYLKHTVNTNQYVNAHLEKAVSFAFFLNFLSLGFGYVGHFEYFYLTNFIKYNKK